MRSAPKNGRETFDDDGPEVGKSLRLLRVQRDLSLEALAKLSGVSRAMLGQIELGQSTPTIKTLWRISRALDVPFSALIASAPPRPNASVLRARTSKRLTNHDGTFTSRALFPPDGSRKTEFYELHLAGHSREDAEPHPAGTFENLVVAKGTVEIVIGEEKHLLSLGDAIRFRADQPHSYHNPKSQDATMYLVMSYE